MASLAAIGVAVSCRDPTEIELDVHTNVPWHDGIVTSFTVGTPGATESAFSTTETRDPWGADGFVGSLVVVPGAAKDAPLAAKIVMGVTRDPHDCTIAQPDGCIFARRTLSYVPHRALKLPIELYARCIGVSCDASTTCNFLGQCVPAAIDPSSCDSPSGCSPPGDQPPADGGGTTPPADGGDASTDATVDAPNDGPPTPSDGGDAGPPHEIDCGGKLCEGTYCCWNALSQTGTCIDPKAACPTSNYLIRCDGPEDCVDVGGSCCDEGMATTCSGAGMLACKPEARLCHAGECPSTFTCTPNAYAGAFGECTP